MAAYTHNGGTCPLNPDTVVRVTFRNGVSSRHEYKARQIHWYHFGGDWDVVSYEILAGEREKAAAEEARGP